MRKEAKKAKKNGLPVKSSSKLTHIPNLYPNKRKELGEQSLIKALEKMANSKDKLITKEDLDNLIKEENEKIIIKKDK